METTNLAVTPNWWESDWYREWIQLTHPNADNRKVGYWKCYYKDGKIVCDSIEAFWSGFSNDSPKSVKANRK